MFREENIHILQLKKNCLEGLDNMVIKEDTMDSLVNKTNGIEEN